MLAQARAGFGYNARSMSDRRLRLAASNGQPEPDWDALRRQYPDAPGIVEGVRRLWLERQRPAPPERTSASHRRLLLVVSHSLPPDDLDRYFESAEAAYPHLRHWVVQIKQAARAKGIIPRS